MPRVTRRSLLASGAALAAAACGPESPPLPADRRPPRSRVGVFAASYGAELSSVVLRGLRELAVNTTGARVVLKPNLVEFDPNGVINTHPALIAAAADAFLSAGAREVTIAEGPGHRRDNEYLLVASGLDALLREKRLRYVDLNFDRVVRTRLASRFSDLGELYLPATVMEADLFVSMPKLKTHHWAGVTLSMKNLFGVVPGSVYGWPKNPLHWAGIDASIVDLASTIPARRFAIVDGVVGMQGNGPIQGDRIDVGAIVMGEDFVAVDATCCQLMGLDPARVRHIEAAGAFLGNADPQKHVHLGEELVRFRREFTLLPQWEALRG